MLKISPTKDALNIHNEYVSKKFNDIINKEYIERDKPRVKKYFAKCFLKFLKDNFNDIINGEPDKLIEIQKDFLKLSLTDEEMYLIKSFFIETGYDNFPNKQFLNHLNIDTCVYCNRNYTLDFKNLNNSRAQLDHWFPKADFPILALSFYNLIPSCQSCNHIKGGAKDNDWYKALDKLNHPYLDKNDFKFTWFYDDSINKTKVEVKSKNDKTLETLNFNKTKDIYNANSGKELKDLLDLRYKYSKNYLDILCNNTFEGLNLSKEEAYRMIFGIEIKEEDYHKRPFSKFKHDIIEELKNIK